MTMQTFSANFSAFTTDAAFRAWGLGCSTALQACGLVLTADTGQINWATVTRPTTASAKAGYEIYKFADSLQATKPVFIRVDYGSGAQASGQNANVWLTTGTGSNGAGVITGPGLTSTQLNTDGNTVSNNASPCQFTHSTANGYLLANFGIATRGSAGALNDVSCAGLFILERTKDATDTPTGDGLNIVYCQNQALGTTAWRQVAVNFNTGTLVGTGPLVSNSLMCIAPLQTAQTLSTSSVAALYKQYTWIGSLFYANGCLGYFNTDQANGATFTATPVGSTAHTYYCWTTGSATGNAGAAANVSFAWAWEN